MSGWELSYEGYVAAEEGVRETLCTLGNGYFATRGALPDAADDGVHYPGTYIAGCYDRLSSTIDGREVEHESLVNAPNWLPLAFRHPGEDWLVIDAVELASYRQLLDLRRGLLVRRVRFRDPRGRTTHITERRLVHMSEPHLAAIELAIEAEDWSGPIEVRSMLDGAVENRGVERYRRLASRHLAAIETRTIADDAILIEARTARSGIAIAEAARTRVYQGGHRRACQAQVVAAPTNIALHLACEVEARRSVRIEKVVALYTSRDRAISAPGVAAAEAVVDAPEFAGLLASHELAWEQLWRSFDIRIAIDGPEHPTAVAAGAIARLQVFHVLQSASRRAADLDAGIGARGLHGEAYRGHVFWDELFVFPLLNFRAPDITRGLLLYRYRRLPAARRAARKAGHRGAMYPWQSGSDGREETPSAYFNLRSSRWIPDHTRLQRHVGAAIAYNVWQYFQVTGDRKFLADAGAEMILEIARFFASLATFDTALGRFRIRGVMGPDEFHYGDAERPGLVDNAYTNVMAAWLLWHARDVLELLPHDRRRELRQSLALADDELARWDEISRKLHLPVLDAGILAQFDGYADLPELDWDHYRATYGNIQRLDLILEAEGDAPNRYKASKQADVLMLFYLFSSEELAVLYERLGYPFDPGAIPRTIAYYLQRTSDGSTLSRVAHGWVLARSDRHGSWELCRQALVSDVADIQGGTTHEGVHLGAMAGSIDLLERCYTGLELREDVLWLNPRLPVPIRRLEMLVRYRGHTLELVFTHDAVEISTTRCDVPAMRIAIRGIVHELRAGERCAFAIAPVDQNTPPLP